ESSSEEVEAVSVKEKGLEEEATQEVASVPKISTSSEEAQEEFSSLPKPVPSAPSPKVSTFPFSYSQEKWRTIEKTSRIATVTYFDRVYLQRTYPIKVRFTIQNHFVARMAWKLELRGENQLNPLASTFQVLPIIPGAYITPPTFTLSSLAPVGEVEFWITPFQKELLHAAKIQIWFQGHMVDEIPLDIKVCSQGMTGVAVLSGLLCLTLPLVAPGLLPHVTNIVWTNIASTPIGNFIIKNFGGLGRGFILLSLLFFFLAILSYLKSSQRLKQKGRKFALRPSLETFSIGVAQKLDQISLKESLKDEVDMPSGKEKFEKERRKKEEKVSQEKEEPSISVPGSKDSEGSFSSLAEPAFSGEKPKEKESQATPSEDVPEQKVQDEKEKIECGKDLEKFYQVAQQGKEATALAATDNVTLSYFTTGDGYFVKRVIILGEDSRPELLGEEMRVAFKPGEFKKEWLGGLRDALEDFEGGLRQILESLESKQL
ncbi:MAG: hypothetical protein D6785_11185, partial [Planctomycetota bacterium]